MFAELYVINGKWCHLFMNPYIFIKLLFLLDIFLLNPISFL